MLAVDSEHSMYLQDDSARRRIIFQTLSNPNSAYNRFDTGSVESLKQDGIRAELIKFHKTWYSANIMNLVLLSNHSLKQMEKWVKKMFSPIVNKHIVIPDLSKPPPFSPERLGVLSKLIPVKDKHILEIIWVLPYCELEF